MTRQSGDRVVDIGSRHERFENVGEHLRIGTRGERALLGAAQLRRGDGLHGLGDLPRVDHAADAAPDVENVCHKSVASCQYPVPRNTKTGYWVLATGYYFTACLASTNCCFASLITLDKSA